MKKTSLLVLLFTFFSFATVWAEFTPTPETRYALQEKTSGLYLDIQTMDINEPNANTTTNNISLNAKPYTIYFEAGSEGRWKMRNINGQYVGIGSRNWNAVIGATHEWIFAETEGLVSIAKSENNYIGWSKNSTPTAGNPIYNNAEGGNTDASRMYFTLIKLPAFDCTTGATAQDGKMHFTSERLTYEGNYNKLRFTLTESGAFYKNGAKRMSLDSFVLCDGEGNAIALTEKNITGNNGKNFAYMLDGANGTFCNATWDTSTATDDWFEITFPNGIDLAGAFSFSFVTENTTMNAKAFRIELFYGDVKETVEYTFAMDVPKGKEVAVEYDDETVSAGHKFDENFDIELFSANEISGYTWSIVVDEENKTITLKYTEAPIVENPKAVVELINRIGGSGTDKKFKFVLDPSMNSKQEVFLLGRKNNKVLIKGSTISAITTGIGWYLNNYANINIAWNSLNEKTAQGGAYADLSSLPLPAKEETRTCDAKYRYYLNYCTFGYSMTSWTWKRWQQEIDWMALHGINIPLQIVGLEEVWRMFLTLENADGTRKYNYSDTEAKSFVAGPAFTAWWGMNNLEGWGGTTSGTLNGGTWEGAGGVQDDAWYVRQAKLAKQILERQRELGIEPVLPGFSGMVPTNFTTKTGIPTDANGGKWAGGFQRPRIIDPTYNGFADIAKDYYDCLKAVMGESQYYSMDPFHEGGSIKSGAYTEAYYAIYEAMEVAKEGSQWVIQQWQWNGDQRKSLNAVPAGRLIVLDLFSDGSPAFDSYNGYAPQDAVFCAIPNFGGRSGLMGRLNNVTDNYFKFKAKYASIKGIGTAPEAIEQTPVGYDLIYQLPWMGSKPDVQAWIKRYATARYGTPNATVQEAWELLRQGPLNYGADAIQGPVEDVWAARPNLNAYPASAWGKTLNHAGGIYTKARRQMLIDATYKLLGQKDALNLTLGSIYESNYLYDLVEFGGAVMADYAYDLLLGIRDAKNANGTSDPTYIARRNAFLELIEDVDRFKGTNLNFRLGKWTQEARDAATEVEGATTATPDWYEFNNARTILTTWASPNTNLNDYSYRSWQGLLKDFYLPRWKYFFDNDCNGTDYGYFEWNWAHGKEHFVGQKTVSTTPLSEGQAGYRYSREPEGNTIEEAEKLLNKYIIPVAMTDGVHYAYRYLANDMSNLVTIVASAGATIDLTPHFGTLTGVTVTGDFITGNANDLSRITIKADISDGAYIGTVTLSDGTTLTFSVVINPRYYGVYHINYKNGSSDAPVFIGYNADQDNAKNIGYKFIATGTYSTDTEADKMFTIAPSGSGYSLSAQGKYLKSPNLEKWEHIMFSDNKDEAGSYIFEEVGDGITRMRSTEEGINYVNDYDKLVFGNDKSDKEELAEFSITEITDYPLRITSSGIATLCLPFNVVMPTGMYAYDIPLENIARGDSDEEYTCTANIVATPGQTLKKGTPVFVKAVQGEYPLSIPMSDKGAKGPSNGSIMYGNYVMQDLEQGEDFKIFTLSQGDHGIGFYPSLNATSSITANSCWIELPIDSEQAEAQVITLIFKEETTTLQKAESAPSRDAIYNLAGQQINTPQKGINIIGDKKVVTK